MAKLFRVLQDNDKSLILKYMDEILITINDLL